MKALLLVLAFFGIAGNCSAAPTPIGETIPECSPTEVRCVIDAKTPRLPRIGKRDADVLASGEYAYKLWVPKGYSEASGRRWPCVFISSPSGGAGMGPMADYLKAGDYIVVMLQDASNKGKCDENFISAHDDVIKRLRVAEGLKFATGMSGGSRASSVYVQYRPGFAGLFQQAAGFGYDSKQTNIVELLPKKNFCVVSTIGSNDTMNFTEWPKIADLVPKKAPFFPIITKRGHDWAGKDAVAQAFMFMESTALITGAANFDTRAAAKTWLSHQAGVIAEMPALADKISFGEKLLLAAGKQGTASEPDILAFKKQLQEWKSSPDAAKEISAAGAFEKLFSKTLEDLRVPFGFKGQDQAGAAKKAAAALRAFAKKYPGTHAAESAETFASGLDKVK